MKRLKNLMFISIAITAFAPFSVFYLLNRILQTIAKKLHQNDVIMLFLLLTLNKFQTLL